MKKQVFNPFLPLKEYIPDVEPHVFGDRVYIYGSHDREGGYTFCMEDYVVYSAPVTDLTNWRCEGVTYRASQDPDYEKMKYMYAPDVVRGNDGRYYLYYCMSGDYGIGGYQGAIHVAVCDSPAGQYEFLGYVRNPDGSPMMKYVCFDPAAMNDNGTIRIYYGTQYGYEEEPDFYENEELLQREVEMFGRSREEILSYKDSIMGPNMLVLEEDMLTVKEEAKHIIPYKVKGTDFEQHPFFEAASMRRVGNRYYFIYSSLLNHELCYAVSDYPDRDFVFGGTIVSNGDIGFNGRTEKDKLNMTGTTHGSIVEINGQWYVFYHRLTHKSDYSRQVCTEKIQIAPDGSIPQVEITSCGLNDGPLAAEGTYPAVIACNITNGRMPHGCNSIYSVAFPNVTNIGEERFIGEIEDGTLIGFKYFAFSGVKGIGVTYRPETESVRVVSQAPVRIDERCADDNPVMEDLKGQETAGLTPEDTRRQRATGLTQEEGQQGQKSEPYFEVRLAETGKAAARISLDMSETGGEWKISGITGDFPDGVYPVYFMYHGNLPLQLKEIHFQI